MIAIFVGQITLYFYAYFKKNQ